MFHLVIFLEEVDTQIFFLMNILVMLSITVAGYLNLAVGSENITAVSIMISVC